VLTLGGCDSTNRDQAAAMIRKESGNNVNASGYAASNNVDKASNLYDAVNKATSTFCSA